MAIPGTIRAYYGGNTYPYAGFDQSNYFRDLTAIGSPTTPSSPTPPEGDQWLLGGSDPSNYWKMPVGAFPTAFAPWVGVVAFNILYQNSGANQETFFRFGNGGSYKFECSRITSAGNKIRAIWSIDGSFNQSFIDVIESMVPGTNHEIRIESRLTGVTFKLDGGVIGTDPNPVFVASDTIRAIGGQSAAQTSYQDAFMISDDPDEPFRPTVVTTIVPGGFLAL